MSSSRLKNPATPAIPGTADAAEVAKDMLLWARRHGFAISMLTVGDVTLAVVDLAGKSDAPAPAGDDPFARYGGKVAERLRRLQEEADGDPLAHEPADPDGLGVG